MTWSANDYQAISQRVGLKTVVSVTPDWRSIVSARAWGAIETALFASDRDIHIGQGVNRITAQTTGEYHDRFLIELIQNGYDAHPASTSDGRIEIAFARDEGTYGTLYVANTGRPFSPSNFRSICELGLSDKPPGESIGNKGVGFKSVLQISRQPEIYSAEATTSGSLERFLGGCFSFASDIEVTRLLTEHGHDAKLLDVVRRETAPFHIPVFLEEQPDRVRDFARRGFSTVVRLPIETERAASDVSGQLTLSLPRFPGHLT